MPTHLFTYGSLMFPPVWERVVTGTYTSCDATLDGYRRLAVIGEDYPVAVADTTQRIKGILYRYITPHDLLLLDAFEGEYYQRTPVTVTTPTTTLAAETYVLKPTFHHIAATHPWDVETFRRSGLARFMARYQGFLT